MIRHIVLIRARDGVTDADMASVFADIHALQGTLPGLRSVVSGRSDSPEHAERGYLHGMVLDFDDAAALARYAIDPRHKAAGAKLRGSAVPDDGILVFDLPIQES